MDDLATVFPPVRGYLDTATVGIPPRAAVTAMQAMLRQWESGTFDVQSGDPFVERARSAFATLVGADARDVAQGASASMFIGLVAASLPDGARVLVADGDFTSVLFPFAAQSGRGVTVESVPVERIADALDARHNLVAVSAVQSGSGAVLDLDAVAAAADHHGADVLLDATQAAGWLPLHATRFTYVVAAAYKWLLSPRGSAFMAIRPDAAERLVPQLANWYAGTDPWTSIYGLPLRLASTAKRFDLSPAWLSWPGAAEALEWLAATGIQTLNAYDVGLANRLREGLGLPPSDSAIVSIDRPGATEALAAAGVKAISRADRTRISCHVPANLEDVDRALTALT